MKYTYTLVGLLVLGALFSCSVNQKMKRGKVVPANFYEKISFTTAKGIVLVPCMFEGEVKHYYFDTGAQLSGIQRTELKGKRVTVRGASNRSVENGTEVLKSFKIGNVDFRNTFATNGDLEGLKEQIPNFGGVIGRPIIDRANWLIDLPNKELIISDQNLSDGQFLDIPLIATPNGAPYTMIKVNGKSYKAIIDLGSTAMLNVPEGTELAEELMNRFEFKDQPRDRYTVGGLQKIIQQVGTIPFIEVGEHKFEKIEVAINTSSQIRIGINLFKGRVLYIDNQNKKYSVRNK